MSHFYLHHIYHTKSSTMIKVLTTTRHKWINESLQKVMDAMERRVMSLTKVNDTHKTSQLPKMIMSSPNKILRC